MTRVRKRVTECGLAPGFEAVKLSNFEGSGGKCWAQARQRLTCAALAARLTVLWKQTVDVELRHMAVYPLLIYGLLRTNSRIPFIVASRHGDDGRLNLFLDYLTVPVAI